MLGGVTQYEAIIPRHKEKPQEDQQGEVRTVHCSYFITLNYFRSLKILNYITLFTFSVKQPRSELDIILIVVKLMGIKNEVATKQGHCC